ncbi:MAG: type II toxin-antitoxin system VapC family toxin [Acidobacteriaceae bacterium]
MIALDTHAVVWLGENPGRLSRAATRAIESAIENGEELMVSSASFYEIARGIQRGRIESSVTLDELLAAIERRFTVAPMTAEIAATAAQLPAGFPRDPFDRIIAATAMAYRAALITADEQIRKSGVLRVIW